jgi:hypothetical protein
MKKIFMITTFAIAVSVAASFGTAQIEVRTRPTYDQQRDQQWVQTQRNQEREQQQRDEWQRAQWQQDERQRHNRHQQSQDYNMWMRWHGHDYDNRR